MKKTLAALIVSAVAASAANAAVVYDNEGTKVELNGSLRLILEKADAKKYDAAGNSTKTANSALRNAGSRFGITVKHNLDNDFYALGRLEFRFDDTESRDQFGSLYAKRAYVGLGSKATGDITFGRQLTIADDLTQANDYEYGFIPKGKYIPTSGTGVVRYDYKGIEGLQLSANYNFGQRHNDKGRALTPGLKNAFGFGALYTAGDLDARFAYGHTNLAYQVTPMSQVYGNYLYERVKGESDKEKTHGFLLGADYKLHKQVVLFVEGKYVTTKEYVNDSYDGKTKDRAIGVGMRVFF